MKNNQSALKANLHHFLIYAFATLIFTIAALPISLAADGDLDASFGTGGKTLALNGASGLEYNSVLMANGKIVASREVPQTQGFFTNGQLARFNENGSLDTSFGTNGQKIVPEMRLITALTRQTDGKFSPSARDKTTRR